MSPIEPMSYPRRMAVYLVAAVVLSAGAALTVRADVGVPPNDVMNTGLADHLEVGVGTASWITAAMAMVLAVALGRRPRLAAVLGVAVVGVTINATLAVLPTTDHVLLRTLMLSVGLAVLWVGIAIAVATDVGTGALDLIMLALVDRGLGIRVARWGIEAVLLVMGMALGGAVGVGTVLFVVATGPVMAALLPRAAARMGISLHRQPQPAPSPVSP